MARHLGGRIHAGSNVYFYLSESRKSPYYLGMKEYHGFFARSSQHYYEPHSKQFHFTFVAKNMDDLKAKIKAGSIAIHEIEKRIGYEY
jgi:hypothetical protein